MDLRIAAVGAALAALNVGAALQIVILAVGFAAALAVGRAKRKDAIIADLEKSIETEERLHSQSRAELEGAQARADEEHQCHRQEEKRAAKLEGQLAELRQYAAPEAFKEIVSSLTRLESVLGTAIAEQGELIMKNTELQAGQVKVLELVADDLGRLAERLGASGERPPGSI